MELTKWASDWQHAQHAVSFDFRAAFPSGTLIREYESFSDVGLLNEAIRGGARDVAEVGCATGEFHRYLRLTQAQVRYRGFDVSEPAVRRAREKYPDGKFVVVGADTAGLVEAVRRDGAPDVAYCKDVLHHQVHPREFLSALVTLPKNAVILRCRTRDAGATVWDPEQSCQYHYDGWMPYIVINLDELVAQIQLLAPQSEIVAVRHRMILGGVHNRYLPRDCYLPQTGTAETAIAILLKAEVAGRVRVEDRQDGIPAYTLSDRLWFGASRLARMRGKG